MLTSWNVGMGGVVGLRYEALPVFMEIADVPKAERKDALSGLKVMEAAALEAWRKG